MKLHEFQSIANENYMISEEGWFEDLQVNNFDKWWAFVINGNPTSLRGKLILNGLKMSVVGTMFGNGFGVFTTSSGVKKWEKGHVIDERDLNGKLKFMNKTLDKLDVLEKYKNNVAKVINSGKEHNRIIVYSLQNNNGRIVEQNNKYDGYNKLINALSNLQGVGQGSLLKSATTKDRDFTPEERDTIKKYCSQVGPYVRYFSGLCKKWCDFNTVIVA